MDIEIKSTSWHRLRCDLSEELTKEVVELFDDGYTLDEVIGELGLEGIWEEIEDSDCFMDPSDNNGQPTLEVYNDERVEIWNNGTRE